MSRFITVEEYAEKYRKAPKTVRKWITDGLWGFEGGKRKRIKLYARKVGRNYLIVPETGDGFIGKTGGRP